MDRLLIGRSNYRLFSYLVALNLAGTLSFSTSLASEAPSGLVYQGRIMKPDNSPLEAVSVLFDIEVYSPDGACLLFEETHTISMVGSGGSFALTLGTGTPIGPSYFVKEVFSNTGAFTGAGSCSYSPSTGDSRRIRVTFDEGGGPVALQDQIVQSVPYALYASKLEGKGKSDFLQINTTTSALSQANANSLFQNATYTELMALAGGTSTVFAKSVDLPVSSGVLNLSGAGQGVRVLDVPAGGDYAVNKNYSDGKIGGKSIDATNFAGLANGESVKWDTTANSGLGGWVRYTPASTSGFVVNGGQAGAVSLGSTDANSVSLLTNNAARMTILSSGNVGIGTSTPGYALEVNGNIASSMLFAGQVQAGSGTATFTSFQPQNGVGLFFPSGTNVALSTASTERLRIDTSGRVGIGTSVPYGNLHISHPGGTGLTNPAEFRLLNSTDQGSSQIILGESDSAGEYDGMRIRYHSTSDGTYNALQVIGHYTGGDTSVHLSINRNNGYVGIGTTSPSSALDVVGTVTVAEPGTNSVIIGYGNSASASGAIAIGSGNSVGFNTNSTAMGHSNDSSLGGSSFGRGNTTSGSTAIAFGDGNSVSGAAAAAFGIGVSNTTANSLMIGPSDAAKVTILSSGNVGIGTTTPSEMLEVNGNVKATSFISTSDVRLKTDIQKIEGLNAILKLQGLQYRWKNTGEGDAGVLAQEVEKIFPDAVRTDPVTGYKGVKYLYLIAPLIESAKELYEMCKANETLATQQTQELEGLKNENAGLKSKLESLERRLENLEKKLRIY